MDGLEATRIIRQQRPDRITKIIGVTGCNQKSDREVCIEAGMDNYISKPVKAEDLDNALSCCYL
jgi:CheY-like chemotaxis protein